MRNEKSPLEIWKTNKWRLDFRKYTRDLQKLLEKSSSLSTIPGELYFSFYETRSEILTDKHHVTPLFLSFGRFRNDDDKIYVRGINIFYLSNSQKLEILEDFHSVYSLSPDSRIPRIIKLHEKWMKISPFSIKNFEEKRLRKILEIKNSEWGFMPLLKFHLLGNFNSVSLNEDFQKENFEKKKPTKKKKSLNSPKEYETEVITEELVEGDYVDIDVENDI